MGYQQREQMRKERKLEQQARAKEGRMEERLMEAHHVIDAYEQAYTAANNRQPPKVTFERLTGWYNIAGHRARRAQVEQMTRTLWARIHEQELSSADD